MPNKGKNAQILKTYIIPLWSASLPSKADPIPAIPNANPKNNPLTIPTLPGINSCAYTNIAENAEAITTPVITANIPV